MEGNWCGMSPNSSLESLNKGNGCEQPQNPFFKERLGTYPVNVISAAAMLLNISDEKLVKQLNIGSDDRDPNHQQSESSNFMDFSSNTQNLREEYIHFSTDLSVSAAVAKTNTVKFHDVIFCLGSRRCNVIMPETLTVTDMACKFYNTFGIPKAAYLKFRGYFLINGRILGDSKKITFNCGDLVVYNLLVVGGVRRVGQYAGNSATVVRAHTGTRARITEHEPTRMNIDPIDDAKIAELNSRGMNDVFSQVYVPSNPTREFNFVSNIKPIYVNGKNIRKETKHIGFSDVFLKFPAEDGYKTTIISCKNTLSGHDLITQIAARARMYKPSGESIPISVKLNGIVVKDRTDIVYELQDESSIVVNLLLLGGKKKGKSASQILADIQRVTQKVANIGIKAASGNYAAAAADAAYELSKPTTKRGKERAAAKKAMANAPTMVSHGQYAQKLSPTSKATVPLDANGQPLASFEMGYSETIQAISVTGVGTNVVVLSLDLCSGTFVNGSNLARNFDKNRLLEAEVEYIPDATNFSSSTVLPDLVITVDQNPSAATMTDYETILRTGISKSGNIAKNLKYRVNCEPQGTTTIWKMNSAKTTTQIVDESFYSLGNLYVAIDVGATFPYTGPVGYLKITYRMGIATPVPSDSIALDYYHAGFVFPTSTIKPYPFGVTGSPFIDSLVASGGLGGITGDTNTGTMTIPANSLYDNEIYKMDFNFYNPTATTIVAALMEFGSYSANIVPYAMFNGYTDHNTGNTLCPSNATAASGICNSIAFRVIDSSVDTVIQFRNVTTLGVSQTGGVADFFIYKTAE